MFASALGCLGAALSMTLPWPQVWRSVAHRRTTGLSASGCWLGAALPIGWITYGLLRGDRFQVVTNTVTGSAATVILIALLLTRTDLRHARALLLSAAGAAGVLLAAAVTAAAAAVPGLNGRRAAAVLGVVLAVGSVVAAIPQPLSLLRDRAQDLSGLSPLRWRLGAGASLSWLGYGVTTGQPGVWISAAAGLAAALTVCAMLARGARPPAAVPAPARGVARVRPVADAPTLVMPALVMRRPARSLVAA